MKKAMKKIFLGSDDKLEDFAQKFAAMTGQDFDDMKEAKIGLYDMPSRLEEDQ